MAMIGKLKEISWVDGVLKGSVIRSCKQEISVTVAHPGNTEFHPQVNDTVVVEQVGSEYLLTGVVVDSVEKGKIADVIYQKSSSVGLTASLKCVLPAMYTGEIPEVLPWQ